MNTRREGIVWNWKKSFLQRKKHDFDCSCLCALRSLVSGIEMRRHSRFSREWFLMWETSERTARFYTLILSHREERRDHNPQIKRQRRKIIKMFSNDSHSSRPKWIWKNKKKRWDEWASIWHAFFTSIHRISTKLWFLSHQNMLIDSSEAVEIETIEKCYVCIRDRCDISLISSVSSLTLKRRSKPNYKFKRNFQMK